MDFELTVNSDGDITGKNIFLTDKKNFMITDRTPSQVNNNIDEYVVEYNASTWSSDNEDVATVDQNGVVTAVSEGEARITATAQDGSEVKTTITVRVTIPKISVEKIEFNKESLELKVGDNETLTATITPENATNKQISKINKQNNRIEKRNAAKIASAQNKLNEVYNGADGKGSKNSNGELVRFKFNVIGKETNDLSGGSNRDLLLMSRAYGLKARTFGLEDVARAPIVTNRSTGGALGLHKGYSISIAANAPDITLAHEVGHSLWLDDSYPNNKGSLMDYSPTNILIPSDVDLIWEKAKEKY